MTKLNNSPIIGILCAVWTLFNTKFNCPDLLTSPQTKIQQQKKDYNILKFQQPLFIDISFLLNPLSFSFSKERHMKCWAQLTDTNRKVIFCEETVETVDHHRRSTGVYWQICLHFSLFSSKFHKSDVFSVKHVRKESLS